ncbi:MAG: hypothetical protein PWP23_3318 [Candidatus Sumerlaeota bacterium]|nr:hypothetical protein [Candidatus Sumerlaeota bacterium]
MRVKQHFQLRVLAAVVVLWSLGSSTTAQNSTPASERLVSNVVAQTSRPQQAKPASNANPGAYLTVNDFDAFKGLLGQKILIRGTVDEFKPAWNDRAPNVVYLRENGKEIEIVYWTGPATTEKVPDLTKKGTPVFARGTVEVYRGRLQINIDGDLWNLSATPLAPDIVSGARDTRKPDAAQGERRSPIQWEAYSPLSVLQENQNGKSVIVYARSRNVPLCSAVEKAYLLNPDLATVTGPRTIYFLDLSQEADLALAQQLPIVRVPALLVLEPNGKQSSFSFTKQTTPSEVLEFLKAIPR